MFELIKNILNKTPDLRTIQSSTESIIYSHGTNGVSSEDG